MEQNGPSGLQLVRELVKEILPGAQVSKGIEAVSVGQRKPAIFSIRKGDAYATFILDEGVVMRQTGTKRVFDLRIPNSHEEIKAYLKELFRAPPETA